MVLGLLEQAWEVVLASGPEQAWEVGLVSEQAWEVVLVLGLEQAWEEAQVHQVFELVHRRQAQLGKGCTVETQDRCNSFHRNHLESLEGNTFQEPLRGRQHPNLPGMFCGT